jgi:SAM-dependent methyltransferase
MADPLLDNYRRQSLDKWETMAQAWARERDFLWQVSQTVGKGLVEKAQIKPGDTVLELAAGTGETGYEAARKVGDSGRLISSDFSPQMVEMARSGGENQGLENIEYRVMDAEHMDLEDDSVDAVICKWGYMLMADPEAALGETRRVLRPGGRLAFSVWGPPDRNPWLLEPTALLVERGLLPVTQPGMPGVFSMADQQRIRSLVTGAGFEDPQIEEAPLSFDFDSYDGYWDFVSTTSGLIALALEKLSDAERADLREELRKSTTEFQTDNGFRAPGLPLTVVTK